MEVQRKAVRRWSVVVLLGLAGVLASPHARAQHSADVDGSFKIELGELLRLIQFYNAAGFHCAAETEDGYAPGGGTQDCAPHSSDYRPRDWAIGLSELLRLIQFYNAGRYVISPGTEDGFRPAFAETPAPICIGVEQDIPDNNPAGIQEALEVFSEGLVKNLSVGLVIRHSWIGDLTVSLEHVDTGTAVSLIDRPGRPATRSGCSSNDLVVILDDGGTGGPIEDLCGAESAASTPPSPPSYTPRAPLSAFDGENLSGIWILSIADHAAADTGVLEEWCLIPGGGGTAGPPFREEARWWGLPDVMVSSFTITPGRVAPGTLVTLRAEVTNRGHGMSEAGTLSFFRDSLPALAEAGIPALGAGEVLEVDVDLPADFRPGRHVITAEAVQSGSGHDRDPGNNRRSAVLRVSGEEDPIPELVTTFSIEPAYPNPGDDCTIRATVHNPSFVQVDEIPVLCRLDGENMYAETIRYLLPNASHVCAFEWLGATSGQHLVEVFMDLGPEFPNPDWDGYVSHLINVPGAVVLYDQPQRGKWASMGPNLLSNGTEGMPSGSVGRMLCMAFHPADRNVMYAGAAAGGLWKTADAGDSWAPLTDRLPSLMAAAVALDPANPDIVYLGTGDWHFGGGLGIFKSIDGGLNWAHLIQRIALPLAPDRDIPGVSKIAVRYDGASGDGLLYAGTHIGLLRHRFTDPLDLVSFPSEWDRILEGEIAGMIVDGADFDLIHASVHGQGIYRTSQASTATGNSDWDLLTNGLPPINYMPGAAASTGSHFRLDPIESHAGGLYASLMKPTAETLPTLGIYRSYDNGDTWQTFYLEQVMYPNDPGKLYNPFIREHPNFFNIVYFGGVKLFRYDASDGAPTPRKCYGIHDDMQAFEWDPWDMNHFYILNDGGIWRCSVDSGLTVPAADDSAYARHRNNELRVTMFFDIDAAPADPDLMIGGTQDCGTILYTGGPQWKTIRTGDGLHSLIGAGHEVFYSQEQFLFQTQRSERGIHTSFNDWRGAANGLPPEKSNANGWHNAQIALHPTEEDTLAAIGEEVHYSDDGGGSWGLIGPDAPERKGRITRVSFQPVTHRIAAGTAAGQLWVGDFNGTATITWTKVFERPSGFGMGGLGRMAFSPVDHQLLYATLSSSQKDLRVWLFRLQDTDPPTATAYPIAQGLPKQGNFPSTTVLMPPTAICADGHQPFVVYAGTRIGVFRGEASAEDGMWTWQAYNDGLPFCYVRDLVVDPASKELRAGSFGRGAWRVITGP